jgi:hypothetical protein
MAFAKFLGPNVTFYDIQRKEEIIAFLDTKIKSIEEDPDRKWITTWNDYLNDIKYFFRWLYNSKKKIENEYNEKEQIVSSSASDWERLHLLELRKRRLKTKPLSRDRGDIAPFLKFYIDYLKLQV